MMKLKTQNKRILYSETNYDNREIYSVMKVLEDSPESLVLGKETKIFEKKISKMFGKKFGVFVNSGSSANLLALSALNLKKKSEIITPALNFSTTVSPIIQLGLIPHFVDIQLNTLNIDVKKIEYSINENTSAIMVPNLIGNIPDWEKINNLSKKYNLYLIEDSADTLGYSFKNGNTGKISDIVTTSFYASHIITCAGIGGMICTNNIDVYKNILVQRGWGRSSELFGKDNALLSNKQLNERFNMEIDGMKYDKKFLFEKLGYNFFAPEICAAFGNVQLKKFKSLSKKRNVNFNYLKDKLKKFSKFLIFPFQHNFVETNWLAYPLILKKNNKDLDRNKLQKFLENKNIQTRPIFSGDITKHPMIQGHPYKSNSNKFDNALHVMKYGLLIGCHPKLKKEDFDRVLKALDEFFLKG